MKVAMLHYSNCFSAAVKIMQISMALFKIIGAATDCLVEGHMYVAGLWQVSAGELLTYSPPYLCNQHATRDPLPSPCPPDLSPSDRGKHFNSK